MDYKELVKDFRAEAEFQRVNFGFSTVAKELDAAASAIETLLAERDEAVAERDAARADLMRRCRRKPEEENCGNNPLR